jgi:uncharacterized protein (TIGR02145 family)
MNMKNISVKYLFLANFLVAILIVSVLFSHKLILSASAQTSTDNSPDALAVRIIPNPNHLSAQRWYQLQGFSGSPQTMIVDGYKAVRDGRTVYVSAANVSGNDLHTNIYLISYDQQADQKTIDIFGRILKNWKFNTNLSLSQQIGKCFISDKSCKNNSDCPENYTCGNGGELSALQANKCVIAEANPQNPTSTPVCILDSDCPSNLFCAGLKAKIVRDLDRLEKIVLLKEKIQAYYNVNKRYPVLGSGTYLPHVAISTWPSWQNSFLNQIGVGAISDPVNKLGSCYDTDGKFNLDTCWNPVDNVFFLNSYNGSAVNHTNFVLPNASYAMTYLTNSNGSDYKMCATMETALGGNNYTLASGGTMSSNSCTVSSLGSDFNIGSTGFTSNSAPYIVEKNLSGLVGTEFLAYVKAVDAENHPISWSIVSDVNLNTWGGPLSVVDTNNPNQKIIKAQNAGSAGEYKVDLRLTDSLGSSTVETLIIKIDGSAPQVVVGDIEHNLSYGNRFYQDININFAEKIGGTAKKVEICSISPSDTCRLISVNETEVDIKNGLVAKVDKITNNNWKLSLFSLEDGSLSVGTFKYKVVVTDSYNEVTEKIFTINILANNPVINFDGCLKVAELGDNYVCLLKTNDTNEGATFSLVPGTSLPTSSGLVDESNSSTPAIRGIIKSLFNQQEIKVRATNKYGKSSEASFKLSAISSCGSYLVQHPGGPWNVNGTVRNHGGYYKTALIGNQCWLQDNLNVGTMILASTTPNINNNVYNPLNVSTIEKYCLDNSSINCDIYGGLYTWTEATKGSSAQYIKQGICPPGFRVALDSDWTVLENYLFESSCRNADGWQCGGQNIVGAGEKIRFVGANDFKALFGFYASKTLSSSPFSFPGSTATSSGRFMSTVESGSGRVGYREIQDKNNGINRVNSGLVSGNEAMSVRCIKGDGGLAYWLEKPNN